MKSPVILPASVRLWRQKRTRREIPEAARCDTSVPLPAPLSGHNREPSGPPLSFGTGRFSHRILPGQTVDSPHRYTNVLPGCVWTRYYMEQARKYDINCIWWDCGGYRLLDREKGAWEFPEIVQILVDQGITGRIFSAG